MTKKPEQSGAERLHKLIARAGIASRRASEDIIAQGRVLVNGIAVKEVGAKADPAVDRISVDGQPLRLSETTTVVLLHKPSGVMSTRKDPEGRTTVTHLMPDKYKHLHPIGRLDFDTSGVLFLTDDGDLTQLLTHPSHGVDKVYWARVRGTVTIDTLKKLESGIYLEDGKTAPCRARVRAQTEKNALVQLTLREGKNRQVRRMLEAVGHPVGSLRRVKLGGFGLDGLLSGEHRVLIDAEVHQLRKAAETKPKKVATKSSPRTKAKAAFNAPEKPTAKPRAATSSTRSATETSHELGAKPKTARATARPATTRTSEGHPLAQRVARRFENPTNAPRDEFSPAKPAFAPRSTVAEKREEARRARETKPNENVKPKNPRPAKAVRIAKPLRAQKTDNTTKADAPRDDFFSRDNTPRDAAREAKPRREYTSRAGAKPSAKTSAAKAAQADKYASKARRGARAWGGKTRKRAD